MGGRNSFGATPSDGARFGACGKENAAATEGPAGGTIACRCKEDAHLPICLSMRFTGGADDPHLELLPVGPRAYDRIPELSDIERRGMGRAGQLHRRFYAT